MELKGAISPEQGVVAAEVTDDVSGDEVARFLADIAAQKAMGYRKVFDITLSRQSWTVDDIRRLAKAFDRAAGQGSRGAVAIVARSSTAERLARDYLSVSQATRPFAVFPRSEEARRWIDGLLAPAYGGNATARVQAKREQAASVRAIARTMSLKADQLELERQAD